MAVLFTRSSSTLVLLFIFFFFFLIPRIIFTFACPIDPPFCYSNINISSPFGTSNRPSGCIGTYPIQCIGSKPSIQVFDTDLTVKSIDYDYNQQIITLEDERFTTNPPDVACSFVYSFTSPIDISEDALLSYVERSIDGCRWGKDSFPLLNGGDNTYSVCKDFSFSYSDESDKDMLSPSCRTHGSPFFGLWLSFNKSDGKDKLLVLSAGYSHALKLGPHCLNAHVCSDSDKHIHSKTIMLAASVGGAACFVAACCIFLWCYSSISGKKNLRNDRNVENFLKEHGSLAPKRYKYSDVKKITESFRHKLGQGGYGSVFKGTLSDGRLVAVKVLSNSKENREDFFNEIASICRSSHVNIVTLLGFCSQGSKQALIYEYMCNGSLDKLIHSEKQKKAINWEKLYQIATGIARGLEYLHLGSNTRIVHFDIKPHNILLDQDFRPKISDFGLSKLCVRKDSILSIEGTRGTAGYIAPEVFSRNFGVVSSKSDIYSYGMMVLEMVGAKENVPLGVQNTSETYFPYSIYKHLEQNQGLHAYGATVETEKLVKRMMLTGLWCIQTIPQNRPSITKVIEMLEGSVHNLQVPPKPCLSFPSFGPAVEDVSSLHDICSQDCSSPSH